ncbi:MAG: ImmA/IrrE family metallo-endopeptidase [Pseudomonadota bacterium]
MFKRGFKSWCESVAAKYRKDLDLAFDGSLPPKLLAQKLNVLVWKPEDIPGLDKKDLTQLTKNDPKSWSAVTLQLPQIEAIIVNSAHALVRQTSSIMHELSHIILEHKPARVDVSDQGYLLLHNYDRTQEDEADWLAATLLVPREALLVVFARVKTPQEAAKHFGVSTDLLEWRKRMTGVQAQLARRSKI